MGAPIDPDSLGGDSAWIDYYGGPDTIEHVSFSDVIQGKTTPGKFRDKIVVVGATAAVSRTCTHFHLGDDEMAGPEIQATRSARPSRAFP